MNNNTEFKNLLSVARLTFNNSFIRIWLLKARYPEHNAASVQKIAIFTAVKAVNMLKSSVISTIKILQTLADRKIEYLKPFLSEMNFR